MDDNPNNTHDGSERFKDLMKKAEETERMARQLEEELAGKEDSPSSSSADDVFGLTRESSPADENENQGGGGGKTTLPLETRPESHLPPPPPLGELPRTPSTGRSYTPPGDFRNENPPPDRSNQPDRNSVRRPGPSKEAGQPIRGQELDSRMENSGMGFMNWQRGLSCITRMVILALFGGVILAIIFGSIALYQYNRIASNLPNVEDLREQAASFETTRILDRNGNVLYEILDPNAGRRTYVPLEEISPYLVAATIATEDANFYSHPGFDALAISRALIQNLTSDDIVSGASTITQQLTKLLLFAPEEQTRQTYSRKIREAILAAEITRRYSKDEILELYLNEIYYGNLAYGVEAAAQTYFGTSARNLTLAQASFLAGIPQLPAVYDVYTNRDLTMQRHETVLVLMYQVSQEQNCIYVSNNQQDICIGPGEAASAAEEMKNYQFPSPYLEMRFPHWVNYIRSQLEERYDSQTIYRSGFTVYTTMDPDLQSAAQEILRKKVENLANHQVDSGALVAIRPSTGEILAMIGSADFWNENIEGEINMAVRPRQPGSAIKPLTYLAAFEKGWTPATLLWDVRTEFPPSGDPNDPRPPYIPVNYDERYHGPVTVRSALANSYNIPAVKALDYVGIYDGGLVDYARRLGISTLNRSDYGLSLTLGGGEVTLLELTAAYSAMANGGRLIPPVAITRIVDHTGNTVYEYQVPAGEQVIRPEHAFLISSILSDNEARTPAFGPNSVLKLPFQAAAKTGTTNDFRDNWTLGYTPDFAVGVWVGNPDYSPMVNTSGLTGAAPIWAEVMQAAAQQYSGGNPSRFVKPVGIVERVICSISGTVPSKWCPSQRSEFFAGDQLPLPEEEDLWQEVEVDTWTGKLASSYCSEYVDTRLSLQIDDPWGVKWVKKTSEGKQWAKQMGFSKNAFLLPEDECGRGDSRPILEISSPRDGDVITTSPLKIFGRVDATGDFKRYQLEFGPGQEPVQWEILKEGGSPIQEEGEIFSWDIEELEPGIITFRFIIESTLEGWIEKLIRVDIQVPTITPTPTETLTPSSTIAPSGTPTPTRTPSSTPTPSPTSTSTPTPSQTPNP